MSIAIPLIGKRGHPSENLTQTEHDKLKALFQQSRSFSQLASKLRMNRMTVTRILKTGAGSPDNIKKIRNKLPKLKTAA